MLRKKLVKVLVATIERFLHDDGNAKTWKEFYLHLEKCPGQMSEGSQVSKVTDVFKF